jgi:tetratricopeptide (TPR) repeat protein
VTPFTRWVLGEVLLPDTYSRVVDHFRTRSEEKRLSGTAKRRTGIRPGRGFATWYRLDATWEDLVHQGADAYERLVDSLAAARARRVIGSAALDRDAAEALVQATVAAFIGALDSAQAVTVHDDRDADRHATTQEQLSDGVDAVLRRLDVRLDFDAMCAALPPVPKQILQRTKHRDLAERLAEVIATDDPKTALVSLVASAPAWLRDAPGDITFAVAELAHAYQLHQTAAEYFELAGDLLPNRAYLYARAATYRYERDPSGAEELIARARRVGDDPVVAAVVASWANDAAGVRAAMTRDQALADGYLASLYLQAVGQLDGNDAAIAFMADAVEVHPDQAGLVLQLGWAIAQRSNSPGATSRTADRVEAMRLALRARDLRRSWHGDSGAAVELACSLAVASGRFERVIELGSVPPDGEAQPSEAASTAVRLAVAQASVALGRIDRAIEVANLTTEGFQQSVIRADVLWRSGADPAEIASAFEAAWDAAEEDHEKVHVWLGAAAAGVELGVGAAELASRTDEVPALVQASALLAREHFADAIELLRPHRANEHAVRLLVASYHGAGRVDEATQELLDAANRFNSPDYLVDVVELFLAAGRASDAAVAADAALLRVPRALDDRRGFLHRVGTEHAGISGEWGEMARRARAWIDDLGPRPPTRWHLAHALYRNGDHDDAWSVVAEHPALTPETEAQAKLWMILAASRAPGPETAQRMLDLVDKFSAAPGIGGLAVTLFYRTGDKAWGDLDAALVTEFQRLLETHAVDLGAESEHDVAILRATTPEQLLEKMRPILERQARSIDAVIEKVRDGWPYGLLSAVAGRPYASAYVHRAAGCLPIYPADAATATAERAAATAALGRSVCVDTSTLGIAWYVRGQWPTLMSSMSRLELSSPAKLDIVDALEAATAPSTGSIYFDTTSEEVRGSEDDPAARALVAEHVQWIASQLDRVSVRDWPSLVGDGHPVRDDPAFLPWMSSLDMAQSTERPLWCDDLGLRRLAREAGVPSFGTVALLEAMQDSGRLTLEQVRSAKRTLLEQYAVDLPVDDEWVHVSAASANWGGGPANMLFARSASWSDARRTLELWSEVAIRAGSADPAHLPRWVWSATHGIVRALSPTDAPAYSAIIISKGMAFSRYDSSVVRDCVALGRRNCEDAGLPSPVPHLFAALFAQFAEHLGTDEAATFLWRAGADLEGRDRDVLREILLGIAPGSLNEEPSGQAEVREQPGA